MQRLFIISTRWSHATATVPLLTTPRRAKSKKSVASFRELTAHSERMKENQIHENLLKKVASSDSMWSLWNEGNFLERGVEYLDSILTVRKVAVNAQEKTALVKVKVDSQKHPPLGKADDQIELLHKSKRKLGAGNVYEKACQTIENQMPLDVRAYQVLHETDTADVSGLVCLDTSKLPIYGSNQKRFVNAFAWATTKLWNLGQDGDINVSFGRVLLKHRAQKFKRTVLPMWPIQNSLLRPKLYKFSSIVYDANSDGVGAFLKDNGFAGKNEPVTTYIVVIKKTRDPVLLELNTELQPTNILRAWDRHLVTHLVRPKTPDICFMLRGRVPSMNRVASPYFETEILKFKNDTVESVLAPELGDIQYAAKRVVASWNMTSSTTGVTLRILQTKRTPVLTTFEGDQGDRLEYELLVTLPNQAARDVAAIATEVFEMSRMFGTSLDVGEACGGHQSP